MKFSFEMTEYEFDALTRLGVKGMESDAHTQMVDKTVDRLIGFADRIASKAFTGWDLSEEMPGLGALADYTERNASAFAKLLPLITKLMSGEFGDKAASTDTPTAPDEANEDAE